MYVVHISRADPYPPVLHPKYVRWFTCYIQVFMPSSTASWRHLELVSVWCFGSPVLWELSLLNLTSLLIFSGTKTCTATASIRTISTSSYLVRESLTISPRVSLADMPFQCAVYSFWKHCKRHLAVQTSITGLLPVLGMSNASPRRTFPSLTRLYWDRWFP